MDWGLQFQTTYRKVLMTIQLQSNEVNSCAGIPDGEWFKGDGRVFSLGISRNAKLLFFALQTFRDNKTGYCWPSYEALAEMIGVSRPTVIKAMGELTDLGVVKKESRSAAGRGRSSNGYWVSLSAVLKPMSNGFQLEKPMSNSFRADVKPFDTNQTHRTKSLQDSISCPYVRNAREAETTEKISEPGIGEEASASSGAEAPLRGGREKKPRGKFWWTHAWEVWPVVKGLVSVPGSWPSSPVFTLLHDWPEVEALFEGHRSEGCFPATLREFVEDVLGESWEAFSGESVGESREADPVSAGLVDVSGPEGRGRMSTLRSDSPTSTGGIRKEPGSGGAWGDQVPLPSPKHVYGVRSDASEDHATGPVDGVQGSPVPSPTPEAPKRPWKPQMYWMYGSEKRWADDGKLTTIPPTFVPNSRHVAFAEAYGLDVESISKRFVAKHLAAGTLVQCWDWHFAELLEMKRRDKLDAEREAERLRPELEAAEAARQEKRREWSERLEAQAAGAVPPTQEFLDLRPKMDELRAKYGGKPKPKGEPYGWRANSHAGGEPHGGPRAAVCQQRDPGVLVHPGLDPQEAESGDPDVGGRGDDVRPLRRVEDDGGERRGVPGEGEPCDRDGQAVGAQLRARGPAADLDQPGGGRDRPVPEVCDREAGEDELGAIDVAAEFFAWRKIRDAQLAAGRPVRSVGQPSGA